jgi:hypothetical protein
VSSEIDPPRIANECDVADIVVMQIISFYDVSFGRAEDTETCVEPAKCVLMYVIVFYDAV